MKRVTKPVPIEDGSRVVAELRVLLPLDARSVDDFKYQMSGLGQDGEDGVMETISALEEALAILKHQAMIEARAENERERWKEPEL